MVSFDESRARYRLEGPDVLAKREFGAGDRVGGFNYHGVSDVGMAQRMTLLKGKSVQLTGMVVREDSTGRWEPQPASELDHFLYDKLAPYGWHQQLTWSSARVLVGAAAVALVVVVALVAATIAAFLT